MLSNSHYPTKLARSEYAITTYFLSVLPGVTPADIVNPDFWQHVSSVRGARLQRDRLQVNDKIEVVAQDGSFEAELRVMAVDVRGLWAQVRVLRLTEGMGVPVPGAEPAEAPLVGEFDPDGYRVEFAGPHKFRIVRGNDVLETHLPTKAAAYAKLAEIKAEKVAA